MILVGVTVSFCEDIRCEFFLIIYNGVLRVFNIMHHGMSDFAFHKTQIFFSHTVFTDYF
jgi:hypothetical protein